MPRLCTASTWVSGQSSCWPRFFLLQVHQLLSGSCCPRGARSQGCTQGPAWATHTQPGLSPQPPPRRSHCGHAPGSHVTPLCVSLCPAPGAIPAQAQLSERPRSTWRACSAVETHFLLPLSRSGPITAGRPARSLPEARCPSSSRGPGFTVLALCPLCNAHHRTSYHQVRRKHGRLDEGFLRLCTMKPWVRELCTQMNMLKNPHLINHLIMSKLK